MKTRTVILAPHPDDEVFGCSQILVNYEATVVFITDGVPPWIEPGDAQRREDERMEECRRAWAALGVSPDVFRLGFPDANTGLHFDSICSSLAEVLNSFPACDIFVPAYEGAHPDHDVTFAAAQRVRSTVSKHEYSVYALYRSALDGSILFGSLTDEQGGSVRDFGQPDLAMKRQALECFKSQLVPGSILGAWLNQPGGEEFRTMPEITTPLPDFPLLYRKWLDKARHGIGVDDVLSVVERRLEAWAAPNDLLS